MNSTNCKNQRIISLGFVRIFSLNIFLSVLAARIILKPAQQTRFALSHSFFKNLCLRSKQQIKPNSSTNPQTVLMTSKKTPQCLK